MKKILLSSLLSCVFFFSQAQIVKVNPAAVGANDGTSWTDAYTDLQTALTNTSSGVIWVVAGTYYPGASGNNSATFTLKNGVQILGGFNGTEFGPTQRNPAVNVCILSGDLDMSGTITANDAYHVVSTVNTGSGAILDGFTITGGNAVGSGADADGGGILCRPTSIGITGNPQILNCIITQNYASGNGGGVAAICNSLSGASASPIIVNCKITNNTCLGAGSGIYGNAIGTGTGVSATIENCLIYGNSCPGGGNALYVETNIGGGCATIVKGSTFAVDAPGDDIIYFNNGNPGSFEIDNSIMYGLDIFTDVTITGNYNDATLTYLSGTGNMNVDPLYVNAGANDYHLSCYSPCIDAGSNSYSAQTYDLYGNPRISGSSVDMGVHEANYTIPTVYGNATNAAVCQMDVTTLYGSGTPGVTYTWSGGVSDNVPFVPSISDTYTVTGTDANGCVATSTVGIVVNPLPSVTAGASATVICEGDLLTLTGSGTASNYSWDNGVSNGVPFPANYSGMYTVVGVDANGCVSNASVNITTEFTSGITAGADMDVCRTGTPYVSLNANAALNPIVQWSTLGSGTFVNNLIPSTDYYLSGADASGTSVKLVFEVNFSACPVYRDTMELFMQDPVSVSAGTDISQCADLTNAFINGNANNAASVLWTTSGTGTFTSPANLSNVYMISPGDISAGTVNLVFEGTPLNLACPNQTDTVVLNIRSLPSVTLPADFTICETDSILLQGNITGGTPPFNYNWSNGIPVTISTFNNEYYFPTATDIITLNVSDLYGCFGQDNMIVTVDSSNKLSGTMHVGAGVLTDGVLYMLKFRPQQLAFDTMFAYPFTAGTGTFSFSQFPHGNYLIKVVPDSLLFPNLLPTYYGDVFQWDSATVINHNCVNDFVADINMITLLGGSGTGTIAGNIIEGAGFGTRYGFSNNHDHVLVPGGPLKGIDVKLGKNPSGGIQARTSSDTTGHYEFTNLPNDSYRIYVDIPGLPMDSFYIVNVNTTIDSIVNLDYFVDSNSVYPILPTAVGIQSYTLQSNKINLYPNPAKSYTSVTFDLYDEHAASISLLDVTGKQLMNIQLTNLPKGKHEYQLNLEHASIKSGFYFIQVQSKEGTQTQKLIIE